jgi:hypothetical protein
MTNQGRQRTDVCEDRLRFHMSTVDGVLVFKKVEIDGIDGVCRERVMQLVHYLKDKPLSEISYEKLAAFKCDRGGACFDAVVEALAEHIEFFGPSSNGRAD